MNASTLNRFGPFAGRVLIAMIFIISGLGKLTGFGETAGMIAGKGIPLPEVAATLAIIIELGAGAMVLLGWQARFGAATLFVYTLVAALIFHNFWGVPPTQAHEQMIHFMKNMSMLGGLIYVAVYGSGALSVEKAESDQRAVAPISNSYGTPSKGAPARNNSLDFRSSI
jgi:putative oxidoreductase